MRKVLFVAMLWSGLVVSTSTRAWTTEDSMWQLAYIAVHMADWGQTRDIAAQCEQGAYFETNPIIGKCPSSQWVNTYFLTTALLHTGVARNLPQKYRRMFQAGTLGMELGYVTNNAKIGLNIRF